MADSKRLRVLKALCEHLESEIVEGKQAMTTRGRPGGVYKNTLVKCLRGRMFIDDSDELPIISVLENPDPDRYPRALGSDDGRTLQIDQWSLLIQGWADDDKEFPLDPVYELMADVKMALSQLTIMDASGNPAHPNYLLGELINELSVEPGTCRPSLEQVSDKAFFWLRISLSFTDDLSNPYS